MSDRQLCVDSDVFVLLAAAGRLERAADSLGFRMPDLRRLPALVPMLERGNAFRRYPADVRAEVARQASGVTPLTDRPADDEVVERLGRQPKIDDGERLLYALVAERPLLWLTTGDTSSMRALCSAPELGDIRQAVASRVVCLEAVVYLLVERDGLADVCRSFAAVRDNNRTLRCLLPDAPSDRADPLDGPRSYLRSLCRDLGRGFLHCPPCVGVPSGGCRLGPTAGETGADGAAV